jgi:non-ribosomal peptide synthetase component F
MRSSEAPTSVSAALRSAYEEHADKPAVKHGDSVLSYAELGMLARHIASALQESVDCTGSTVPLVAVVIEGSIEYVATLVGVLEAGCAYLPLDPQAPDAYLRKVIEDSGVAAVVATEPVAVRLRGLDVAVLTVQACSTFPIKDRLSPLRRDLDPAYAIYTSGSSGEPKGVLVSHKALLNSTLARTEVYGSPRRQALILSVSFDVTTGGVFWTLLSGGLLVISMARPNDLAGTIEFLRSESVSHIIYPPSLYATLLDRLSTTALPSLSAVILGGERWSDLLIERHAGVLPEVDLYNEYGPTETCVWSSYAQVYDSATRRSMPLTIGRPIRNTS